MSLFSLMAGEQLVTVEFLVTVFDLKNYVNIINSNPTFENKSNNDTNIEIVSVRSKNDRPSKTQEQNLMVQNENDVGKGSIVQLPLWLATEFVSMGYVKLKTPLEYEQSFLKQFKHSLNLINLKAHSKLYYDIGGQIASFLPDIRTCQQVKSSIMEVFKSRYIGLLSIVDQIGVDRNNSLDKLDYIERECIMSIIDDAEKRQKSGI